MEPDDQDLRAETPKNEGEPTPEPRHFSREPWWVVPIAGVIAALCPLLKYGQLQRQGIGIVEAMTAAGGLGMLAATILVARSHVRSPFWSGVVLCLGILVAGIGASLFLAFVN